MTLRLFIAVHCSGDAKARLLALRNDVRGQSRRGNFSSPEHLHLTLAFLGACDAQQTAAAKQVLAAADFAPLDIIIDRVGRFRRGGGDLWWAGVRETPALMELQRDISDRLIAAGFVLERRKYTPHITLGREIVTSAAPWNIEPFGERVTRIELMKSERIAGKLVYTAIDAREASRA